MARKGKDTRLLSVIHPICCGLDVHKGKISACLITMDQTGKEAYEIREYGTFTDELIELREWLIDSHCPIVAMESTGVYWRPVHNIIEGYLEVILVNARHVKNVPGRKTDIEDSRWLAGLLRVGLVRGSFIPEKSVRHWRELGRSRKKYSQSLGDHKRRVHKVFETANIKIDSVVSDLFGVTGRNLIELLCAAESPIGLEQIEQCTKGSLKSKVKELYRSIQGFFEDHHRFLLMSLMRMITIIETEIAIITERMQAMMSSHDDIISRLDVVPGINEVSAQYVLGELGPTLQEFSSSGALASWSGLCPGNNESAGKRRSGKSPVRKHVFKTVMVEIAWAAVKTKGTYYRDKYYRIRARLGPRKAIVAIAHRILKAIYAIIKNGEEYKELGEDYLSRKNAENKITILKRKAKELGYELVPIAAS
ncbi:MAG: IS110 family transposase [Desulfobulbaceae bacterium DB1]|nr:MAG: IS110 family transposase [Desulfobulbaceae bacterium DB1]OKY74518.1 MAG: IS110 family transposase [Desulfobulbaceae bacterium DB1]OKY75420.1 MAG: IS110 family transposase [Desulfobulbaceae bacterium DB1]